MQGGGQQLVHKAGQPAHSYLSSYPYLFVRSDHVDLDLFPDPRHGSQRYMLYILLSDICMWNRSKRRPYP